MGADGFVDNLIKSSIKNDLLANLWNNLTLSNFGHKFQYWTNSDRL